LAKGFASPRTIEYRVVKRVADVRDVDAVVFLDRRDRSLSIDIN
jgi:hypothetical protein